MKTLVLGYASTDAKGPARILAGPEAPLRDQLNMIVQCKATNIYPDGIVRVEHCELIPRQIGIVLGDSQPKTKTPSKKS